MKKLIAIFLLWASVTFATVTTTNNSISYTGNGTTTAFITNFPFISSSDLIVTVAGVTKVLGTDYTVTGGSDAVGTVTFVTAPANAASIVITRSTPRTQTTSFQNQGSFNPKVHERTFDRQTMQLQDWANGVTGPQGPPGTLGAGDVSGNTATTTGSTTARTLGDRFADVVNVKDFGAKGDGVTDDTAAIQAAFNAHAGQVNAFFPAGTYKVSSPLVIGNSSGSYPWRILGTGAGSATITGNVADYIIKRNVIGNTSSGTHVIEDIGIINTSPSASAGGILLADAVDMRVSRVEITSGGVGISSISTTNLAFTTLLENVTLTGPLNGTGIGILASNHTTIIAPDVRFFGEGIRASGVGMVIQGGRFEVNYTAVTLGKDALGNTYPFYGHVLGNRFEANDNDMNVVSATATTVSAMVTQGSVNSPSGQSKIGLTVQNATASTFQGIVTGGGYSDVAIRVASAQQSTFLNCLAGNSLYPGTLGAKTWDIQTAASGNLTFVGTYPDLNGTGPANTVSSIMSGTSVAGLAQLDNLIGNKSSLNLRGKDVAVGAAVTSLAIVFPAFHDAGNGLNTATATAGGTLTAGTYYYASTFVNALGESGTGPTKSVTVDGIATASVTLSFFGTGADAWRRRVYRGRSAANYDGYYDLPVNSSANFVDTGAAFTGIKNPSVYGTTLPSAAEPDASYAITCTPQWNASCWITAKSTTGFTLNFSVAPGGGGSFVDWHLIR